MMTLIFSVFFVSLWISQVPAWQEPPEIPTGRRTQFLILHENGGYRYGYDTGDGLAAKQKGDSANQVRGNYFYKSPTGENIDLKYTAGVQGFVPEGLEKLKATSAGYSAPVTVNQFPTQYSNQADDGTYDNQANTGDASYSFNINTDSYKRQESSDASGNIQGRYAYTNGAGVHDLQYIAGANTGFVATSGSLSLPNGLTNAQQSSQAYQTYRTPAATTLLPSSSGYSYNVPSSPSQLSQSPAGYSFSYSTGDSSRQESSDQSGNVQGRYSYRDNAGTHDLSFVAGAQTGFQPTGGSLSQPNGLTNAAGTSQPLGYSSSPPVTNYGPSLSSSSASPSGDGSYSFSYNTGAQLRQESSDSSGNVQGRYAYADNTGNHDLSYIAGAGTGFVPTGGSLAQPNGLGNQAATAQLPLQSTSTPTQSYLPPTSVISARTQYDSSSENDSSGEQSNTGDASYSFSIDTDEYKRHESSDASGNVQGSFSYKNDAGNHDLSFVAGQGTGFQPTGGSLKVPPGLSESQLKAGSHSTIGKSSVYASQPIAPLVHVPSPLNAIAPSTKSSYRLGNIQVHSYLLPSKEKKEFGYVFDAA